MRKVNRKIASDGTILTSFAREKFLLWCDKNLFDERGSTGYMNDPQEFNILADATPVVTSGTNTIIQKTIVTPCDVYAIVARVTTAITVTAAVLTLSKAPAPQTTFTAVTGCTLTLPVGAAIGSVYKNPLDTNGVNFRCNVGDAVRLAVTTTSTAGAVNGFILTRRSVQITPTQVALTGYNEVSA